MPPSPPRARRRSDVAAWTAAHAGHSGETWLGAEWFHAELAVYREVASRARFWETDRDPFAPAKEEELASERLWERLSTALAAKGPRRQRLVGLLDACLWGNRVDLSYAVAAGLERRDEDLLVDDRVPAAERLADAGRVEVIADNTGTELALDLALVDAVLEDARASVTLHVKAQPVFVSDALVRDVWRLLEAMAGRGGDCRALERRLREAFEAGRLRLAPESVLERPELPVASPGPHRPRARRRLDDRRQGRRQLPPRGRRCSLARRGDLPGRGLLPGGAHFVPAHDEERRRGGPATRPRAPPRRR